MSGLKRLKKIYRITGKVELLTGLHIGVGKNEVKIGGVDSPVIRNPLTDEPYIPGSSLKGKLRSLLELYFGVYSENGDVLTFRVLRERFKDNEDAKNILKLFGASGSDYSNFTKVSLEEKELMKEVAVTRLSFYDLFMDEESGKKFRDFLEGNLEEKVEVKINRITGTSHSGALNTKERIPAGITFDLKATLKIFEGDNEEELKRLIELGFKLLELDSLGGSGSRGYGKVKVSYEFEEVNLEDLIGAKGEKA